MPKTQISQPEVESAVHLIAHVAFENETYFGNLDGEMGDADFGHSLLRRRWRMRGAMDGDFGSSLGQCHGDGSAQSA